MDDQEQRMLEYAAWLQAYQERVDAYRRGARLGAKPGDCTCPTVWGSILPPPACPYHGQLDMLRITC